MNKIINIYWIRSNLHIVFDKNVDDEFLLVTKNKDIKVDVIDNEAIFNITNTPQGHFMDEGDYRFLLKYNDLIIDNSIISKLDDFSRIFYYSDDKCSYLVSFVLDSNMHITMKTRFMMYNSKPQKFRRLVQAKNNKQFLTILIGLLGVFSFNLYYKFISLFRFKKNRVLCLSENDDEIKWNLKAMYDYLKDNNYNVHVFAENKYSSKKSLLSFLKEVTSIALSDVIFVDNYVPLLTHIQLRKDVKLIQLWHAGVGFKSLGYARFGLPGSPHPYQSCHRKYTSVFVDHDDLKAVYQEVFGVSSQIFYATGMPRLDGYLDKDVIANKVKELEIVNTKFTSNKVILFSPTYRGTGAATAYYDFSLIDLDSIYNFCKKNGFIFVIKMHPFIKKKLDIPSEYNDLIYDYSELNINDLIYVSDVMITDYSSCAYEYSLFDRPLIFYRFDKEIYEYERPIHSADMFTNNQYEVRTFNEVMDVLEKIKNKIPQDRFNHMKRENRSNSCKQIADIVFKGESK